MNTNETNTTSRIDGVVIGLVTGVDNTGQPLVAFAGNKSELPTVAKSTQQIDHQSIGREVALMFEAGDIRKPIVMGLIYKPQPANSKPSVISDEQAVASDVQMWMPDVAESTSSTVDVDGESVSFRAKEELVLKCGKASITLTKAGKVIIRGAYVSTRSSGANRIKGGSVQIN